MVVLKQKMIVNGNSLSDIALGIAFVVVAYSMIFLIFYIITEHIIKNKIVGMIISIIGAMLAGKAYHINKYGNDQRRKFYEESSCI